MREMPKLTPRTIKQEDENRKKLFLQLSHNKPTFSPITFWPFVAPLALLALLGL